MINVVKFNDEWRLTEDSSTPSESSSSVKGVTYREAIDVFAANRPDLAEALDSMNRRFVEACDELTGPAGTAQKGHTTSHDAPRQASEGRRLLGSGARFRSLYDQGKSNAEALAIVRQEFPLSKAGLSDAAWNRARWKKESAARAAADDLSELL